MKKLLVICVALCSSFAHGQICNIDFSQTVTGIYPDTLPTGNVGQSYATDVTFVMPLDTLGYNFTNFHILSVSLPVGLSWQCNNAANNCDYNPQVSQHGCVHISGTPLLAGQYTIDVTVIADLTIIQGYPFTFQIFMEVLPSTASVSNNGFDMIGSSGCAPITVNFTNNNPGMLSYLWNFGNGNISLSEHPAPQVYTTPGDYIVHYTAWNNVDTTNVFTLTNVHINSMSNYGNSFPSYENADAYFKLFQNGTLIYQSNIIGDQNPPVEWTTSINLNPANTYVFEIWEADDSYGETYFGADDYMGSHTLNLNGCNGCGAGTSNFNYSINHQVIYPSPAVIAQDTIHVYGYPPTPVIAYDQASHTISTPDLGYAYQWYFNGSPIGGATNPSHVIYLSGIYDVVAINTTGCVSFSDTMTAVYCSPFVNPSITMNTANNLVLSNYPASSTIAWYVDGVLVQNQVNDTISPTINGNYSVQITDPFGCSYSTSDYLIDVSVSENTFGQWMIYPNPVKDMLTIQVEEAMMGTSVELLDLNGRSLLSNVLTEQLTQINLDQFPSGTYFICLELSGIRKVKRFVRE